MRRRAETTRPRTGERRRRRRAVPRSRPPARPSSAIRRRRRLRSRGRAAAARAGPRRTRCRAHGRAATAGRRRTASHSREKTRLRAGPTRSRPRRSPPRSSGDPPPEYVLQMWEDAAALAPAARYVYDFDESAPGGRDLLGVKGIGLAEMTALGVPVPTGFTVTTDACRWYIRNDRQVPPGVDD